jgi:hypothetical protein
MPSTALKDATPDTLLDVPPAPSPNSWVEQVYSAATAKILQRGQTFFDHICGKVSGRVMRQTDCLGKEGLGAVARLLYGYVLSNEAILTARAARS